jgi:hypothetical protein
MQVYEQIPEQELIKDRWYVGRGRNSNVGFWDGESFRTWCYKFEVPTIKYEGHYENEGCFQPFRIVKAPEEVAHSLLPKEQLKESRAYIGKGINSSVGFWSRGKFITFGTGMISNLRVWTKDGPEYFGKLFEGPETKLEQYLKEFSPFAEVDEGEMLEPFGADGWDRHYGTLMRFFP